MFDKILRNRNIMGSKVRIDNYMFGIYLGFD